MKDLLINAGKVLVLFFCMAAGFAGAAIIPGIVSTLWTKAGLATELTFGAFGGLLLGALCMKHEWWKW